MGMIYPKVHDSGVYKVLKVQAIPEEQKNYPKEDVTFYETYLDIDNAIEYKPNQFLNACKTLNSWDV